MGTDEILFTQLGKQVEMLSQDSGNLEVINEEGFHSIWVGVYEPMLNWAFWNVQHDNLYSLNIATEILRINEHAGTLFVKGNVDGNYRATLNKLGWRQSDESMPHMLLNTGEVEIIEQKRVEDVIRIKEATTMEELNEAIMIQSEEFHMDPRDIRSTMGEGVLEDRNISVLVAYDCNMCPVSTTMSVSSDPGNISGIWNMATRKMYQRRGYGKKLLTSKISQLRSQKVNLLATEEGARLYRALRFREYEAPVIFKFEPYG